MSRRIAAALTFLVTLSLPVLTPMVVPSAVAASSSPPAATAVQVGAPRVLHISRPPAGSFAAPQMTSQTVVTARIHHYNICNVSRRACTEDQAKQAQKVLLDRVAADGPWFVSVNEICQKTFEVLAGKIGGSATMVFNKTTERRCPPASNDGQAFGSALFYPGGVRETGQAWTLSNPGRQCFDEECRTMLCEKLGTFAGAMTVCTAHTGDLRDVSSEEKLKTSQLQAAEYIFIARGFNNTGRRLVMAGDLNLTNAELPEAYHADVDLVNGLTINAHTGLERRIDHIFVQPIGTPVRRLPLCPADASDHCHTSGLWRIPVG